MFNVQEAIAILNEEFNSFGISFSFEKDVVCSSFPNQLKTFKDIFDSIITKPSTNKIVLGMLQSGKTGTSLLIHLYPVLIKLIDGTDYLVIDLLTNRIGHKRQTEIEMNNFFNAFGDVVVTYNEKSLSLNQYIHELNQKLNYPVTVFARTNNKNNIDYLNTLVKTAKELEYSIIYTIDEIHWGQEQGSVFEKYLQENMLNITNTTINDIFIGFSATPYPFSDLVDIDLIHQYLGEHYHGPNFFAGEIHDSTAITTQQQIISFDELDIPLSEVIPNAYHSNSVFMDFHVSGIITMTDNINDYRTNCSKMVENFIHEQLDGKINTGMVIRWTNDNDHTTDLIKSFQLKDIIIISYYGDGADLDIKQTIKENIVDSQSNFVIFVTGAARMADAFPINVEYFVDFTYKSTTLSSLLQGLYGRSCGYNKNSKVFLSDNNAYLIREYIDTKGKFVIHPHESVVIEKQPRGRKPMSCVINKSTKNPIILQALNYIQTRIISVWLNNNADTVKKASKSVLKHTDGIRMVRLFDIITEEVMIEIEKEIHASNSLIKVKLLRPGEIDYNGRGYNINEGKCEIGFRSYQGGIRKSPFNLYPQIFVDKINGVWTIQGLQLRYIKPLETQTGQYCLPSTRIEYDKIVGGMATMFMTEEEMNKSKSMKGLRKVFFRDEGDDII